MELKLVRHLWGLSEPLDRLLPQFVAAGYTAIENAAPTEREADRFREHLKGSELSFIAQVFTQGQTVEEQLESFQRQIEDALGIRVAHETHRGRTLYNPWTTDRLIGKFPAMPWYVTSACSAT